MSKESKEYINQDVESWKYKPNFKAWLLNDSGWHIYHYLRHLRGVEYYGKYKHQFCLGGALFEWHYFWYKRLGGMMRVQIAPNTVGRNFHFFHYGDYIHIGKKHRLGKNCSVNQGVLLDNAKTITIGDNVTICPGVKIVKDVTIGSNVIIGANSVVTHDIPDNCIAAGCPARILRRI